MIIAYENLNHKKNIKYIADSGKNVNQVLSMQC